MSIEPPQPKQVPSERTYHGDTVIDPYAWLADKDDPDTIAYLEAENAYTDAATARLAALREQIFDEIKARTQETDLSVPVRKGGWWQYSRTVEGQQYAMHCRRAVRPGEVTPPMPEDGKPLDGEEVLLDGNELAEGHAFFSLGAFSVSARTSAARLLHRLRRRRAVHAADQGPGHRRAVLPDEMPGHLLRLRVVARRVRRCSTPPWTRRGGRTGCGGTVVGTPASDDVVVFEETDEQFCVGVGPDPRREVPDDRYGHEADQRGVAARRGHAGRRVLRRRAAPATAWSTTSRIAEGPAAHPAQRRRGELRARLGAAAWLR